MSKTLKIILLIMLHFFSFSQSKGQQFDRFPLQNNPIMLERAVQPWTDFTVVGRKSFFVGKENGTTEAWVVMHQSIAGP